MKILSSFLTCVFLLLSINTLKAQTAFDFTSTDCQNNSHHLFQELNAGNVIVIVWLHPCLSCVSPSLTTYKTVENFHTSHPGKVKLYYVDDYGDHNCASIGSWLDKYKMPLSPFSYRFSDPAIDMLLYGSDGMPKVVVLAGHSHSVFYHVNDKVDATELNAAINSAIIASGTKNNPENKQVKVFPNPANGTIQIELSSAGSSENHIKIFDSTGKLMTESIRKPAEALNSNVDVSDFPPGLYFVKISSGSGELKSKFIIY
jgi:hypothetical protein